MLLVLHSFHHNIYGKRYWKRINVFVCRCSAVGIILNFLFDSVRLQCVCLFGFKVYVRFAAFTL